MESWINNTSRDNFLLQQCYPRGFNFRVPQDSIKEVEESALFYRSGPPFKDFGSFLSNFFECDFIILKAERKTLLLIAVYRTPRGNVKSLIQNFTQFFEEKRLLQDKILRLGDLNICLKTTNDASTLWSLLMEDFSLV